MPVLRKGERMQKCVFPTHGLHRSDKYYIVRTYYNELESHWCQGCCSMLHKEGILGYDIERGYYHYLLEDMTV